METNEAPKKENKEKIYWSRARSCRVANFIPEARDGAGRVTQREVSIRFYENIHITSNPKEIEFIEGSTALKNGDVRLAKDITQARMWTQQRNDRKYKTTDEEAQYNESTFIDSEKQAG